MGSSSCAGKRLRPMTGGGIDAENHGYGDRWGTSGQTIEFKVSCEAGAPYQQRYLRLFAARPPGRGHAQGTGPVKSGVRRLSRTPTGR